MTFDELIGQALSALEVGAVQSLVRELYPVVIVDEFQDVGDRLLNVIVKLGEEGRLVLLHGPGQCLYSGLMGFDPTRVMERALRELDPECFEIQPAGVNKQRYCPGISTFLAQYDSCGVSASSRWPVRLVAPSRLTANGNPRPLGVPIGQILIEMKTYLRGLNPNKKPSVVVLSSTNQGVVEICQFLRRGSNAFSLRGVHAVALFDDSLLLQYARLVLELLRGHWCAAGRSAHVVDTVAAYLTALFLQADADSRIVDAGRWRPLAEILCDRVTRQQRPRKLGNWHRKIGTDIGNINKLLRATRATLPRGSPSTAFDRTDSSLLRELSREFLRCVKSVFRPDGLLDITEARRSVERALRQRILFEKLGMEPAIQVMTIHKSKGREYDGAILALEDNRKALWKEGSRSSDRELLDLYRVAISRARDSLAIVAYEDSPMSARAEVQRILPRSLFLSVDS